MNLSRFQPSARSQGERLLRQLPEALEELCGEPSEVSESVLSGDRGDGIPQGMCGDQLAEGCASHSYRPSLGRVKHERLKRPNFWFHGRSRPSM